MKIENERVTVADLQPGDLFTGSETNWELAAKDGAVALLMRTEGDSGFDPSAPVYRLRIERRRWTHGLRSTYIAGCRCGPCTAAQRVYMRGYKQQRRERALAEA